ncbi:DUF3540 domain-containing protein [Marinibaculum pumilum]|uniref:DUF3540 domain-containing protein n=1 Tax=Marinibaculum pumilum TaxID=1766165 RepID=A0ABV7L0W8_9PROT
MGHDSRGVLDRVGAVYVARVVAPPGDMAAEGAVAIKAPEGIRTAEVAIGCMVRPQPGDEVAVLLDRSGAAIVQAVLRRPGGGPLTVSAEEGLTLRAGATSLNLHARHGAFLASDRGVTLAAAGLDVRAGRGFAELGDLVWRAASAYALVGRLVTAADSLVTRAGHLLTRADRAQRSAETLDRVEAPVVELRGREAASLYGESASLNAGEDVRIAGRRINIG